MGKQKLFLLLHNRFPGEKAASLFAAKLAEAFSSFDVDVEVVVPRRKGVTQIGNAYKYYGVKDNFRITYLPTLDLFDTFILRKAAFHVSFFVFSVYCYFYVKKAASSKDIIFSNESLPIYLLGRRFSNTYLEVHMTPKNKMWFYRSLMARTPYFVTINSWKKEQLHEIFNVDSERIIVEPSAVDMEDFDIDISQEDARKKLGLDVKDKIVLYTGHLYKWKGVRTLKDAAKDFDDEVQFIFIGGTPEHVKKFEEMTKNIRNIQVLGHKPHGEIPLWQKAADVVVLPNTAKDPLSKYDTSPMKLFEYMASKRPLVASNIPSITEILNNKNAILVEPDNAGALTEGIRAALSGIEKERIDRAFSDVQKYTWKNRASRILQFARKNAE